MPEIKVPTADGRGLFFEIAGTEPSAAEKDFIAGHVQNYNSLYGPPPPAPPPPVEEMGPFRAGLMNLYADIDTAIGGGAQALGYDDTAQRYYQAAGQTREDVAKRYKPIDLYDVQGLGTGAQFIYEQGMSSLPYLLPMALGGLGGAGLAAGLGATRAGIGLAGAVGSAAGGTGPYTGQMASRQAEEQGVPLTEVDWGKALAYGTVASSLDLATPAVLGVFGKLASRVKMGDKVAKDIAEGWFRRVGKNAFKGLATEAPIETAQQALEIFQANPEKFYELGPEVQKELVTAFIAGGTIGGIAGGVLGGYDVGSDTYRESDEEKKKSAQILLDIEKMQASSENAAKIAKMRDEYQRALAEEKQFESEDLKDLSFGLDTPRYSPSDDMARYRPEVITSYDGTAAGYRVASPTGDTISYHDSFDAARFAAQTANDSAAYSPSIMESFPVIPVSSLEASTREELVKKRYEMGQAGLDNNTSLSEIRNLLGDGIASIERERLTGSPQIPLQARLEGESPRVKPAQAPLETQWRQFVSPEVERMLRAVSAASPAPAAPVTVVNEPTQVDPQTATPVKKDPVVSTPPVKAAPPWGEELDLDGTGDEEGFTFQKGDLGGIDYAKRRRRIKEKAEAATSPDTAANTPSPTGPRFTVEAVDATTAEPDGTNPRAMYDIFRDGKKVGSVRGLAEAQARANKMQADNPTGSVVVRPKNRVFAVNEYRGSAQGDVFVSTIRTFRDQKAAQDYVNTLNEVRERRVKQRIANREAIQRYENLIEKQKAAWQIAERRLKQMGAPPDLIVRVRGVLEDPNTAEADTSIEGYYDASAKLMAISIDIWGPDLSTQELADRIAGVINHEFVHVLQRAGVFDKKDWKAITKYLKSAQSYEPDGKMVKGQTWWERSKNMAPPNASDDLILREAMSEAFRSWAKNKSTVTGKPASIFRRVIEVIKTLGGFAKTNPRIEQIFKEIDEGKRSGVLKQGAPADAGTIDFSAGKADLTRTGGRDERVLEQDLGRGRGGRGGVGGDQGRGYSPLPGAPVIKDATGPDPNVVEAARSYAKSAGIPFRRQAEYAKADPERGRRIADAYEKMPHAPQDPKVREAYEDLKRQTRAQYDALINAGYQFTFYDQYADPYGGNPMNAMRDLRKNKRMAVYGTYDGYGTEGVTGAAIENNPMLEDTGLTWPDQNGKSRQVTANDLFRAVHDAFGHSMEGAGFRADGEENAWQAHIRLYTGPAIGAATSELRGQNSWLNFGPYGEKNAKANVFDTVFAEQKTGLMPEWTWQEGIVPDEESFVVPEEVRKPNGDIDFSKRNLALHQTGLDNNTRVAFEDENGREVSDTGTMVYYEVRLKGRPGRIGILRGSIAKSRPDLFYVEYASFDPDDMSIEETIGLINLLGKDFPQIRFITGERVSGGKHENRKARLLAAESRFRAAKVVFANDLMERARVSQDPDAKKFFSRMRGAKDPEAIIDAAARIAPDLYEQDTAASREASLAEDRMFDAEALSVRQTINVGRMRDRGLVDFSRRLVNTPEFKAWFKGSKVVNPDGSPMIVYHNTDKDFDTFKTSNRSFGAHFGTQGQADFFTRDTGSRIIPAFLSIKNPVRLTDKGTWGPLDVFTRLKDDGAISLEFWKEATDKLLLISKASPARSVADYANNLQREILVAQEQLMAIGVDGIVYLNRFEGVDPQNIGRAGRETDRLGRDLTDAEYKTFAPEAQDSYIAFRPTQIKSALGNRGTFSSEDPRIDFSRRLVNTPEFKAWFRNSQAINDDGTPTVLYHATAKDFDTFKAGGFDPALSGKAIWLTDNPQMQPAAHNIGARTSDFREGTRVLPLFARIERPLVIDTRGSLEWARDVFNNGRPGFPMALTDDAIKLVKEEGYDGIIFDGDKVLAKAPVKRGREVVVFEPNQLKSAVGNRGTFSVSDDRIDFSRRKATIARVEKKKVEKKTAEERAASLAEKFQKNPDLFEVVTNVYGEVMRVPRQITDGLPELRRVIPYLREDELNTNIIGGRGILEMFENAPDATEMAAVAISGRAKRGWYEQSARALIHVFGIDDAPRFSALLAGLSPQTKVEDNAKNALNMWVNWDKAGRPTDRETIIRILGQSVQGKKGEGSILDAWKNNSVTALQAIDPHAINISGNKVNSFMLNLNDVVHAVTNDAWMANYGDVDQDKFSGSSYHGYSAKVRMSAEIASELTGYSWTPREIQETVWSWAKTAYELRKKLGKAGGDQTVGDLLRAGRVTNAMIANTPDFATLFTDGVYRGILERGGYNNQIERIISDNRIAKGSRQLDAAFGARSVYDAEGAGIAPDDYRRYLDTAAARLEQRYQRRKAEAAAKKASGGRLTEGEDSDVDYSRRLVQTLEFKEWFGDSKVVGSDGQPLVMFHGTSKDKDFVSFNVPRNGAWFTGDIDLANDYAETNDSMDLVREPGSFKMVEINTASRVMPVYLSIQNPYRMTPQEIEAMDMAPDKGNTPGYKAWQKDFFTDLRRRGYDGVEVGNGTWVVLDSPTQIKSAIGNRGTFSKDNKRIDFSRVNPLTPADIANSVDRIRYTGVRNMLMNSLSKLGKPIGLNEARARSISNAFIDNFTDHALPIGEIVDQVREKGGNISDAFDAMLKQQLWSSKAEKLIERMNDNFYQPMIRAIRALQISDADIADFKRRFPEMSKLLEGNKDPRTRMLSALMYGRHAPERNLVINEMNQGKLPNGSGISTAEAEAVVKWFESRPNWNQYKLAEQAARRIIEETNNIRVAAGLTPDFRKIPANPIFQKLGMPNGYRYYVPLRGVIEEDTMPNDIDLQRLRTGRGLGTKGPEDISAKGRMEMANNIVEHVIIQNEVSAVRSTKNEVNRAFYDLVKNNQAMLKDVAEVVTKAPMIRRIGDDGIVRLMPDMNYMNSDEYHITKIDGENHVIRVKDARLARTLNGGTGYGDEGIQHIVNLIGGFTRFMSQMATGLNPEFWLRNTPRDVLTGAINIKQYEVEGGVSGLSQALVSNWPTALKAARRANRFDMNYVKTGDERVAKPTDPVDVMYQEFLEDGGFTGYLGLQTIETKIANLNKQITKGENSKLQEGLEVANRFKEFVEAINNSFENATRFAVYKTLRDTGFSRERAAQAAKTVTTNFNAGGWYKNLINPFYMFYNASIQGSMAILTAGVRSPKVRSALAAILVGGVMQDLVGSMLSDEDESGSLKYDKVKEWMARTHMIIPDPTGTSEDGFIKVPLPFGFNAVYNFGRVMSKYLRHQVTGGDYDLGKATASALGTLLDATNPLGASQSFINYVAPTILDPVVALTINRDFDDSIIVKRPISNVGVDLPSSQMYLSSTSPFFVNIADFLNTYSGGTTVMPGKIDFSPDAMQYLFDYFLSGAGAFVRRSAELATYGLPAALQGDFEGMTPNKVPFVRALVGSTSGVDMDRFLEIREEVLRIGKEAKEASLSGNIERLQSVRENYPKELQVYGVIKGADSQRQSIAKRIAAIKGNDRIPDEAKPKLIQQLKEQEKAAMLRAIRAYNTVVEGMSVPPMERPQ